MRHDPHAPVPRKSRRALLLSAFAAVLVVAAGAARLGAQENGIILVSVGSAGNQANEASFVPALSQDGQIVVFKTRASNLTPLGNPENVFQIFARDLTTGITEAVSVDPLGDPADDNSFPACVSADGQLVAFASSAATLLGAGGDGNGQPDVFVRNRSSQATERVSVSADGKVSGGASTRDIAPSISGDNTLVAFESTARLAPNDPHNGDIADAYLINRETGAVELMDVRTVTQDPDPAYAPAVSFDGCVVAFVSPSRRLLPQGQDTDEKLDVYVRDRCADPPGTQRISVNRAGTPANFGHSQASLTPAGLSDDGSLVVFESDSRDLVADDTNGVTDVYLRDRLAGRTERLSVNTYGVEGDGGSAHPSISGDGRFVVFASVATNFIPGDTPNSDIYVRDRASNQTCRVSLGAVTAQANGDSVSPVISRDGGWIAFESTASNLVAGDSNGRRDVFLVPNQAALQECPPTPTPTETPTPTPTATPTVTTTPTETPTPLPCDSTDDCPEDLVCIGNQCVEPPPCTTDDDCPEGLLCTDNRCVPPQPCESSDDCPEGRVCVENQCVAPPPCATDDDCPEGLLCTENKCVPPAPCQTTDDCPEGRVCVGNQCVAPPPCATDDDCPEGLLCTDDKCMPPAPCESSDDCPEGRVCVGNQCVAPPPCTTDDDCPEGLLCTGNQCVPPAPCESSDDCPEGRVCVGNQCVAPPPCTSTDDCPPGLVCDEGANVCVVPPSPTPSPTGAAFRGGGGGCQVRVAGLADRGASMSGFLALLAPLAIALWRRRRRH